MIKILIVDNEDGPLKSMAWAAQGADRELFEAKSEEKALELIEEHEFDVVVTDLELRKRDITGGLNILEAAKKRSIFTQVIVCTAYGSPEISVRAMRLGAFDYLERNPVATNHLKMLQFKIARALEFRQAKLTESGEQ